MRTALSSGPLSVQSWAWDVPVAILEKLADLYHTSVDYLLGRTDQRKPYPPKK